MKTTFPEIISLVIGIISLVCGILLFFGLTKWGKRNYMLGTVEFTNEAVGFILFFIGIILMLVYFIPLLSPRFLSPGMS
jgi:hypothetical protein